MSVNNYDLLGKVRRSDLERSATRILRMIRQNSLRKADRLLLRQEGDVVGLAEVVGLAL